MGYSARNFIVVAVNSFVLEVLRNGASHGAELLAMEPSHGLSNTSRTSLVINPQVLSALGFL